MLVPDFYQAPADIKVPMRPTSCRDELMALGFGLGREREVRERGERDRERERETRGYEPLALHAPIHQAM